jgi:hypothetical protein
VNTLTVVVNLDHFAHWHLHTILEGSFIDVVQVLRVYIGAELNKVWMLTTWRWQQKKVFHTIMIFEWGTHLICIKVLQPTFDCAVLLWLYLMAWIGINIWLLTRLCLTLYICLALLFVMVLKLFHCKHYGMQWKKCTKHRPEEIQHRINMLGWLRL